MRDKIKTKLSARGAKIHCPYFNPCPLCYGCRSYNNKFMQCQKCEQIDKKYNICNTNRHKANAINKMLYNEPVILR